MEASLYRIISEIFGIDTAVITAHTNFQEDLGASRQDMLRLQQEVNDAFGVVIPDEDLDRMKTVHDAVAYIKRNA